MWDGPAQPADVGYPGEDPVGTLWEQPPSDERHVREDLPAERTPFIAVLGSSGFRASWQTGIADVLEDVGDPVRWDLASGGTIPGLAAAAGMNRRWRRMVNAGAPTHKIPQPVPGLKWFERRNLDLGGVFDISTVETWLASWLAWAGIRTFRDLRYAADDERRPANMAHRAGICVSMWRTDRPFPARCTASQLADPEFIHRAFRWAFFGGQFPWRKFVSVWAPDTVGQHLPWLRDEIEDHSPAFWARVSMSQWPACLPILLQDPHSLQLIFLADGGHIDNQPSLFNNGRLPPLPLLNPRLAQHRLQDTPRWATVDSRRMPFGKVIRFPTTPETNVKFFQGRHLTLADRDAMWRRGIIQGRRYIPREFAKLTAQHARMRKELLQGIAPPTVIDIPAFHGFQAVAAAPRPGTRRVLGFRS